LSPQQEINLGVAKEGGGVTKEWKQNVTLATPLLQQSCIYLKHSSPKTDGKNN